MAFFLLQMLKFRVKCCTGETMLYLWDMQNTNITLSPSRIAHNAHRAATATLNYEFHGMSQWLPRMKSAQGEEFDELFDKMIQSLDSAAKAARDQRKNWNTIVRLRKGN